MSRSLAPALAVILFSLSPAAARADGSAKAFKDFGLLGEWRKTCDGPVVPLNGVTHYAVLPSGGMVQVDNLGMVAIESTLADAERLSAARFSYRQTTRAGVSSKVTVGLEGGKLRILDMVDASTGKASISGGRFASGSETAWLTRCKAG